MLDSMCADCLQDLEKKESTADRRVEAVAAQLNAAKAQISSLELSLAKAQAETAAISGALLSYQPLLPPGTGWSAMLVQALVQQFSLPRFYNQSFTALATFMPWWSCNVAHRYSDVHCRREGGTEC